MYAARELVLIRLHREVDVVHLSHSVEEGALDCFEQSSRVIDLYSEVVAKKMIRTSFEENGLLELETPIGLDSVDVGSGVGVRFLDFESDDGLSYTLEEGVNYGN